MTLVSLSSPFSWPWRPGQVKDLYGSNTIDVANEKMGMEGYFPFDGTVTDVAFAVRTVGSDATVAYDVRLESFSTTDGKPSGSLVVANANGPFTPTSASHANKIVSVAINGGTGVSVTRGRCVLVVSAGASGVGSCNLASGSDQYPDANNTWWNNPSGTWSRASNQQAAWAVKYSGTGWVSPTSGATHILPIGTYSNTAPGSSTNPKKYGAKLTVPFKCRVIGVSLRAGTDGDAKFQLLNSGFTELASVTLDKDLISEMCQTPTSFVNPAALFTTPQTLAAGDVVYILAEPTSATVVRMQYFDLGTSPPSGILNAFPGGSAMETGSLNDSNVWTAETTRRYVASLLIDQLDDGVGGGGGLAANPIRGFVA